MVRLPSHSTTSWDHRKPVLLIDRYVEQKEALEKGKKARSMEIELELKELKRELEEVKEWANV